MKADTKQHGGSNYKEMKITPWQIVDANKLSYYEGNILKYLLRHRTKGGKEDLMKLIHYAEKLIEVEYDK